jgi:hypothetical protein
MENVELPRGIVSMMNGVRLSLTQGVNMKTFSPNFVLSKTL